MEVTGLVSKQTIEDIINRTSATESGESARNTGELGKDDFLQLLVTQLRYQDPLKPMEDKEFIAQMAQFSSLEQMQNLNGSFSQAKAFSIIGKNVTAEITDKDTGLVNAVTGKATGVIMSEGKIYVTIGDEDVSLEDIVDVFEIDENLSLDVLEQILGKIELLSESLIVEEAETTEGTGETEGSGEPEEQEP
jgi:flagellar basal-body rod modification protein FlgD